MNSCATSDYSESYQTPSLSCGAGCGHVRLRKWVCNGLESNEDRRQLRRQVSNEVGTDVNLPCITLCKVAWSNPSHFEAAWQYEYACMYIPFPWVLQWGPCSDWYQCKEPCVCTAPKGGCHTNRHRKICSRSRWPRSVIKRGGVTWNDIHR